MFTLQLLRIERLLALGYCAFKVEPIMSSPAEVFDSPLRMDLQLAGLAVNNGVIEFPSVPGIGYNLSAELVTKYRINPYERCSQAWPQILDRKFLNWALDPCLRSLHGRLSYC